MAHSTKLITENVKEHMQGILQNQPSDDLSEETTMAVL